MRRIKKKNPAQVTSGKLAANRLAQIRARGEAMNKAIDEAKDELAAKGTSAVAEATDRARAEFRGIPPPPGPEQKQFDPLDATIERAKAIAEGREPAPPRRGRPPGSVKKKPAVKAAAKPPKPPEQEPVQMSDEEALAIARKKFPELFAKDKEQPPMRTEHEQVKTNEDVYPGDPNFHYVIVPTIDERGNRRSPVQVYKDMGYVVAKTDSGDLACSTDVLMALPMEKWLNREREAMKVHNDPMRPAESRDPDGTEQSLRFGTGGPIDKLAATLPG